MDKYNAWSERKGYGSSGLHRERDDFFSGRWNYGQDFRNHSKYPGAYALQEIQRIEAMLPNKGKALHLFSGSLPPSELYGRFDVKPEVLGTLAPLDRCGDATELSKHYPEDTFDTVEADPPWNKEHAIKTYKLPLVNKERVMDEVHKILKPGGLLIWKDAYKPRYSRKKWAYIGMIAVDPSTGHIDRSFRFFQKVA
ncbi:class I SAM-dependent methyltransferase [Leptospira gomenensis]|uniref:Class I SAM-dependent methyltransferase n=1 Tax=Leptospira gomenensis TaxID=2484974 RepID=A0A5F1YDT0_9LEPT|nr:class I SAM-dependent methyltransferase [Leptospira gomenensis]TGK42801.1 class I SAM-dependent methyltransferase [Leptospira gomenensis]TGK42980.1 class I SAM-dependent methyltransferase [Leptospira gomenensis]TGK54982.1 class I SAM-dependent methyltransferase [Leptospira gomenensis]